MDEKRMKNIPYGMSNFEEVILGNFYYVDKSVYIRKIEVSASSFFYIRPRRFGKSLFLSMLENYYDMNKKDKFDAIFGDLEIGKNPTEKRNTYAVIRLDFSIVSSKIEDVEESFNRACYTTITKFCAYYKDVLPSNALDNIEPNGNASSNINELFSKCSLAGLNVYVLIDEYDNFTNAILSDVTSLGKYEKITHQDGFYRKFFATLKAASTSCLKKIFMTGVSPVTLDDLTSGFNINYNYTSDSNFHEMMGFSENDVREMLDYYMNYHEFNHSTEELISIMKPWYDNYCFAGDCLKDETLYNSDMVLYFLNAYIGRKCNTPKEMLDTNIKIDYKKLMMFIRTDHEFENQASVIQEIIRNGKINSPLNTTFPAKDLSDRTNFVSLLYYFGLLTMGGTYRDEYVFVIPNHVVRKQMIEYLLANYNRKDLSYDDNRFRTLAGNLAYDGEWREYFEYIAGVMKDYSSQRDKIKGESYVHGFTFALALHNSFYVPVSEKDNSEGYCDVFLNPRISTFPDMQHSYIVEFKYVKSSEPDSEVERVKRSAIVQINNYAQSPQVLDSIGHTTLHKIVQVYKGFELKVLEEI